MKQGCDKNLFLCAVVKGDIQKAGIILASVSTPAKIKGVGAGRAADLRRIGGVGRAVAEYANRSKIVIGK